MAEGDETMLKHPDLALLSFTMSLTGACCAFFGPIAYTDIITLAALILADWEAILSFRWPAGRNAVECTMTHFLRLF